jgi:hypothetical protein
MASSLYTQSTADGQRALMRRSKKQGRPARGLSRWNGRILSQDLKALKEKAKELHPYFTVNSMIQDAVHDYVCTKLLNS